MNKNIYHNLVYLILISIYIAIIFNLSKLSCANLSVKIISELLFVLVLVFTILIIFSFNKYLLKIFAVLLVLVSSSFSYYEYKYSVEINISIMSAIFNTNANEAKELLGNLSTIITYITISSAPIIAFVIFIKYKNTGVLGFFKQLLLAIVFILFVSLIAFFSGKHKLAYLEGNLVRASYLFPISISYLPYNYIYYFVKYVTLTAGNFTTIDLSTNNSFKLNTTKPINIILVIGETARAKNFSLNGYYRKTNPLLETQKNLVNFTNFTSCNTGTIVSVLCLLSNESGDNFRKKDNMFDNLVSFIPIFNYLNFKTYLIATNSYGKKDPLFNALNTAQNITYFSYSSSKNKDGSGLPVLQDAMNTNLNSNKLIIMHTRGSHARYSERYTSEFEAFSPVCTTNTYVDISTCNTEYLINEYDNTILYTDYILNSIIDIAKSTNSIVIYTSDHGESLGEGGNYYHGINFSEAPIEQIHIPSFIWFSDSWLANFGKNGIDSAKKLTNKPLSHDNIFHSILDCSFIESNIINKNLSFCNSNK